ncbi:mitochondrial 54S ribosomal protein bL19m [Limtongia smithiae]|uniref:mitochondrial 54S ribosomal protein bL19m n=1 Tax=Limtongia smithiae TaxID=1125753 RepID=UPI0034CDAC73
MLIFNSRGRRNLQKYRQSSSCCEQQHPSISSVSPIKMSALKTTGLRQQAVSQSFFTASLRPRQSLRFVDEALAGPAAGVRTYQRIAKEPLKIPVPKSSLLPKGTNPVLLLQKKYIDELDPNGWRRRLFERSSDVQVKPGDILKVNFAFPESKPSFTGTIMGITRSGTDTSVRLRSEVAELGVEISVKVFSTSVESFEFIARAAKRARRAKLYYLRPDERK